MKITAYILLGLIGLVLVLFFILGRQSQKGSAPGLVDGKLAPCSSKPNCVSSEENVPARAQIAPLSADKWDALKDTIIAQGGIITSDDGNYIAAEFRSSLFAFVDDVEARLEGDHIHIRSSSRVGYSDRGVNRARVEALRAALS